MWPKAQLYAATNKRQLLGSAMEIAASNGCQ
jgi:hypothetical protein